MAPAADGGALTGKGHIAFPDDRSLRPRDTLGEVMDKAAACITSARREQLWQLALADAEVPVEDAPVLVVASTPQVDRGELCAFLAPGWGETNVAMTLTNAELAALHQALGEDRAVIAGDANEILTLGGMAWCLGVAREHKEWSDDQEFVGVLHDVMSLRFRPVGMGSAGLLTLLPPYVSANAAAARLVNQTFGPQFGQLHGPWGSMLRGDDDGTGATPQERCIIVAAVFRDDFVSFAQDERTLCSLLSRIGADAVEQYEHLASDPTVAAFGRLVTEYTPTTQEIEDADSPVIAWRPLREHLRRALRYGVRTLHA